MQLVNQLVTRLVERLILLAHPIEGLLRVVLRLKLAGLIVLKDLPKVIAIGREIAVCN